MNIPGIGPANPEGGIGAIPGGGIAPVLVLVVPPAEATGILALLPPRGGAPLSWLTETTSPLKRSFQVFSLSVALFPASLENAKFF